MPKRPLTQKEAYKAGTDHQFVDSIELGPWTSYSLLHDPKHMCFALSRYKFCAKVLEGKANVLEVGCGDAFGIPIVAQAVQRVVAVDPEDRLIRSNKKRLRGIKNIEFQRLDICEEVPKEIFAATFSVDVIEHLDAHLNGAFMRHQCECLHPDGICIVGTPNITAGKYATPRSRIEHINLKSHEALREQMGTYFKNVFMFSMNDEVVHTGFAPMAHYLFGVGMGLK